MFGCRGGGGGRGGGEGGEGEGEGGIEKGISQAFDFCTIFWLNSQPLGEKNSSNLIKYPFLGITNVQLKAKFLVKIPRKGTKEELPHLCPYPPLRLNIDTCI